MILLAIALAAAISAQPTDEADDAPVSTAVRAPAVGAEEVPPPPAATPPAAAPAAEAGAKALTFESKTLVDGPTLQVVLGQRAVFAVDAKGQPKIEKVEEGQLGDAHPAGKVAETFAAPDAGLMAAAVDGSAEKRATVLKVWNGGADALEFRAVALVMRAGGKLAPVPIPACPVAAGQVRTQSFPAPIVAIGLSGFKTATKEALARPGCN